MRRDKRTSLKSETKGTTRGHKRGVAGYSKKTALLEEAITQMNAGKYGRSSSALKELLALDPQNMEARRLFATLHLRLGSLIPARQAFDSLISEAFQRQDYWLAESLLREYLAAGPRCVPFLEKLGSIYQEKGDVLEAVDEYGKAIDILIEDPDPDNPHLVSQLYKKVRDLAPASPVAFRLASFFDAQTGEFLARRPDSSETAAEPLVSAIDNQAIAEPVSGVMPWDIETPQGELTSSCESIPQPENAIPSTAAAAHDVCLEEGAEFGSGEQRGEAPIQVQSTDIIGETDLVPPELSPSGKGLGDRPSYEENTASADVGTQDAPSVALSSDSVVEPRAGLREADAPRVEELSATAHGIVEPIEQSPNTGVVYATESSDVQPAMSDQPDTLREQPLSLVETEPAAVDQRQIESPPLPEAVEAASAAAVSYAETMRNIPASGVAGPVSPQPLTEPWKEPGFSWESLFDRAWSFGSLPPASSAPQEMTQAKHEVPPTSERFHAEHSPIESESVEIPERMENVSVAEEAASQSSLKPMPWDHIQESIVSIPSAQTDESQVGDTDTTDGHSGATAQGKPQVESEVAKISERAESEVVAEEWAGTSPMRPMPWDHIQESIIPIPPAQVTAPQVQDTETREERSVGSDEVVEAGQPQSPRLAAGVPASEEIASLSVESLTAVPSPAESDAGPAQAYRPEPEAPSSEISPAAPVADSLTGEAQLQSGDGEPPVLRVAVQESVGGIVPTDESSQGLCLQQENTPEAEQESAGAQLGGAKEFEAEPISKPQLSHDFPPSNTNESDGAEPLRDVSQEAPASLVEKRTDVGEANTAVLQEPTTQEHGAVQVTLTQPDSDVPQWHIAEPVTAPPMEQETISDAPVDMVLASPRSEMADAGQLHDDQDQDDVAVADSTPRGSASVVQQEEWAKTSAPIRVIEEAPAPLETSPSTVEPGTTSPSTPPAINADDTRFTSSRDVEKTAAKEHEVESPSRPQVRSKLRGIRIAIHDCIGSCFSTTRAIVVTCVGLMLLSLTAVMVAIGVVGLTWAVMEERPSPAYQSFTTIPQRTLSDFKQNGYFLLVGFDASAQRDPIQVGYEGNTAREQAEMRRACLDHSQEPSTKQPNASATVSRGWFRGADPVGQVKSHADTVQGWVSQQATALSRYGRWKTMSFEDWGYGQAAGLPCASIIFAHELYLAEGFLQPMEAGVERLTTDMEAWRRVLSQAKTLSVKTLALQAMNEDIAVASGLLVRSDFEGKYLAQLSKMLRPLDQTELSMRWPMQSELVSASKTYEAQVKAAKAEDQSMAAVIASRLPLPKQRRLNDYAEYYEASYKAVGEEQHSALPKWKHYIRFPASGMTDYLTNPIETIVGLEPLPPWDVYHGQVMDTEARLRLASLQAWLRRGPTEGDLLARLAKAGQKFYDPYTGLPMLVNMKKGALYSVGHDGKDQDADPQVDVVVTIPTLHAQPSHPHPASESSAEFSKP